MASPCEIHIEIRSRKRALALMLQARQEALRIEKLFSRYRQDNVVHRINSSQGRTITVDAETARMLDFAEQCFDLSDGLFDITSGVLRKVWLFDGSSSLPCQHEIQQLLSRVGWEKVTWQSPHFSLPAGMQIDLGGIGKEYAVDRTVALLKESVDVPFMVNFGGDLHAAAAPESTGAWTVGIEAVSHAQGVVKSLQLKRGALTTSGDAQRYVLSDGVRYGHVLNPATGWPTPDSPSSVTVAGNSCLEAGILSTLAILNGSNAERFLDEQGVTYWCQR
ncbi:MAG: FAD:protein FMN transferase [Granulosicoccus sp.]